MKKSLLVLGFVLAGAGSLAADQAQPQLLVNADGAIGVGTAPAMLSSGLAGGGQAGLEYLPNCLGQDLGLDVDYNYLSVANKGLYAANSDIDVSLRLIPWTSGNTSLWLQGGVGFNTLTSGFHGGMNQSGNYMGFVEPGVRVVVAPRLAIDGGIQYLLTTPKTNMVQTMLVTLGVSVPLDGMFGGSDSSAPAKMSTKGM